MSEIEFAQEKAKILNGKIPNSDEILVSVGEETVKKKRKGSMGENLSESGKTPNKREKELDLKITSQSRTIASNQNSFSPIEYNLENYALSCVLTSLV